MVVVVVVGVVGWWWWTTPKNTKALAGHNSMTTFAGTQKQHTPHMLRKTGPAQCHCAQCQQHIVKGRTALPLAADYTMQHISFEQHQVHRQRRGSRRRSHSEKWITRPLGRAQKLLLVLVLCRYATTKPSCLIRPLWHATDKAGRTMLNRLRKGWLPVSKMTRWPR